MDRRDFLKRLSGGILLATLPCHYSCKIPTRSLRFGIVTDIHYADREPWGTRFYKGSIAKLQHAIDLFNKEDLDFIIELGDLKDQNIPGNKEETIGFLKKIESVFKSYKGPSYHVLGNHDMDCISKEDFLQYTSNPGNADKKTYYSFDVRNIRFIVLDANFNEDGTPYDSGNFDWTQAYLPKEQLEWLSLELKKDDKYVVVFIHQLLDSFSDIYESVCVKNANEVIALLESRKNVLAVFQGHHHEGHYSFRKNIHYCTIKGMIEGELPDNNSFAIVEIHPNYDISISGFYSYACKEMKHFQFGE